MSSTTTPTHPTVPPHHKRDIGRADPNDPRPPGPQSKLAKIEVRQLSHTV